MRTPEQRITATLHLFLMASLLLLAFALRTYHLDFHALWWDEGLNLAFAPLNYLQNAQLAITSSDINPPIYRLLLGAWGHLVGTSAFASRFYGVLCGLLVVAGIYRIVRTLRMGLHTALLATALAAISPMLIYYSQEAKGYIQETVVAVGLFTLWWRYHQTIQQHNFVRWLFFAVQVTLGIGAHYLFAFFLLALNLLSLWLLFPLWRERTSRPLVWKHLVWQVGAQLLGILPILPFIWLTSRQTSTVVGGAIGNPNLYLNGALEFFGRHAVEFALGAFGGFPPGCVPQTYNQLCALQASPAWWGGGLLFLSMLALAAVQVWHWRAFRSVALLGVALLPLLLGYLFNQLQAFFFPRFLLFTLPFWLILTAGGLSTLARRPHRYWRWAGLAGVLLYLLFSFPSLWRYYQIPTAAAEDWRPTLQAAKPWVRAGDALLHEFVWVAGYANAAWQERTTPILAYYHEAERAAQLQAQLKENPRLWLLQYGGEIRDPNAPNARVLLRSAALAQTFGEQAGFAGLFLGDGLAINPAPQLENTIRFENGLTLHYAPVQEFSVQAGEPYAVQVAWSTEQEQSAGLSVFLHVLDAAGKLVAQSDGLLANNSVPFSALQVGENFSELRAIYFPATLTDGEYQIHIGVYDQQSGARLQTANGQDSLSLGKVLLSAPTP